MRRAIAILLVASLPACGVHHSVLPPAQPDPNARIEVGPVLDDNGVDLGPVLVERMRERKLADAHTAGAPGASAPYVTGRVTASDADKGQSGSVLGGAVLLGLGLAPALAGGTLFAIGTDANGGDLRPLGGTMLGIGVVLVGIGIYLLAQPANYSEAKVSAHLEMRRGGSSRPLEIQDDALVRHGVVKGSVLPEEGGNGLLDGVVNGICTEAQTK